GTLRRAVENAGTVPAALRPNQHKRVHAKSDRVWIGVGVDDHFDVGIIRELEFGGALELAPAHVEVVAEQVLLRMDVDAAIALAAAELDAGVHQPGADTQVAEFVADGKPLDLGEIGEVANPQTADRLPADIAQEVARAEIVAVELLVIGAVLLGD